MRLSLALGPTFVLALAADPSTAQGFPSNQLFVTNPGGSNMKVFDASLDLTAEGAPASTAFGAGTSFSIEGDLAFGPDGRLYVAALGSSAVRVYDADGFVEAYDTTSFAPTSVAFGPDGRIYAGALADQPIAVFEQDGTFVERLGDAALTYAVGLAVGPDGHVFYSSASGSSFVYELDGEGVLVRTFGASPLVLDEPRGLAFGPDGRLWVADAAKNKVFIFTASGQAVGNVGTGILDEPVDLAFTLDGMLYVSERGGNTIAVFDNPTTASSNFVGRFGTGELTGPMGLAVSPFRFPVTLKGPLATVELGAETRKDTGVLTIDPSGRRMLLDLVDDPDDAGDFASIFGASALTFAGFAAPDGDPAKKLFLFGAQSGAFPVQDGVATLSVTLSVKADKTSGHLLPKKVSALLQRGSSDGVVTAKIKGGKLLP